MVLLRTKQQHMVSFQSIKKERSREANIVTCRIVIVILLNGNLLCGPDGREGESEVN